MGGPVCAWLCLALLAAQEQESDAQRVLFLTHSAGFVHDVVKRPAPDTLSLAEETLSRIAAGRFQVDCTQDCATITRENLARYRALVFYTTGELPIAEEGKRAFLDWLAAGGAFVGIHCATDTFYEWPDYVALIGGTFDGHPWHQRIRGRVEDPRHPAVDHLQTRFWVEDEIYQFRGFRRHPVRVLLTLDPTSVDVSLGKRDDHDYALAWCRDWGEGRVFYTALGHRAEVWQTPDYHAHLLDGIGWAIDGPDYSPPPPPGARVLVDGKTLAGWIHRGGAQEAAWKLVEGTAEVVAGTSDLVTRESFGDALIHVEFRIPSMPEAEGQGRGNSGVYVQGRYEVQVLDSYGLASGLGDCGALYGQKVPDVNACRKPERWQAYDIEFQAPRFDASGARSAGARITVWHNGRLIHQDVELQGPTAGGLEGESATGPLLLQDHGNPVRYRNVWVLPR
jgi:type 1 glutamine amidotransferase